MSHLRYYIKTKFLDKHQTSDDSSKQDINKIKNKHKKQVFYKSLLALS